MTVIGMDSSHSMVRSSTRSLVAFHAIIDDAHDSDRLTAPFGVCKGGAE